MISFILSYMGDRRLLQRTLRSFSACRGLDFTAYEFIIVGFSRFEQKVLNVMEEFQSIPYKYASVDGYWDDPSFTNFYFSAERVLSSKSQYVVFCTEGIFHPDTLLYYNSVNCNHRKDVLYVPKIYGLNKVDINSDTPLSILNEGFMGHCTDYYNNIDYQIEFPFIGGVGVDALRSISKHKKSNFTYFDFYKRLGDIGVTVSEVKNLAFVHFIRSQRVFNNKLSDRDNKAFLEFNSIPGWMSTHECLWFMKNLKRGNVVIEVGAFNGKTTKLISNYVKKVYSVDLWDKDILKLEEDYHEVFKENLKGEIASGKLEMLRMDSSVGYSELKSRGIKADVVFIDGDHNHPKVDEDINNYKNLVKKGGLFCGHDACPIFPDIIEALNSSLSGWKYSNYGSIWVYKNM